MNTSTDGVVVTCSPDADNLAWTELKRLLPPSTQPYWLDQGAVAGSLLLVNPQCSFTAFSRAVQQRQALFARHLAPVDSQIPLTRSHEDINSLRSEIVNLLRLMDIPRTPTLQVRSLRSISLPYRCSEIEDCLKEYVATGASVRTGGSEPLQVISVLLSSTTCYIGISSIDENLSVCAGGVYDHLQNSTAISRAEYKLAEAVDTFTLDLPQRGRALDMGASPGGWTRALRQLGLTVIAVDPAQLDSRLASDSGIIHIRRRVQEYLPTAPLFDIIVNDMKMDARASVELMCQAARNLSVGGLGIMTLKLPPIVNTIKEAGKTLGMINEDLRLLSSVFRIIGARQLYHNRNEVTVALQRER